MISQFSTDLILSMFFYGSTVPPCFDRPRRPDYTVHMFDKTFFDQLEARLERYFQRYPATERVGVLLATNHEEYLLVEVLEYDERFVAFTYWPRDNSDLPNSWDDVRHPLAAMTISYQEIRSIEFNAAIVREREIGFRRSI